MFLEKLENGVWFHKLIFKAKLNKNNKYNPWGFNPLWTQQVTPLSYQRAGTYLIMGGEGKVQEREGGFLGSRGLQAHWQNMALLLQEVACNNGPTKSQWLSVSVFSRRALVSNILPSVPKSHLTPNSVVQFLSSISYTAFCSLKQP